MTEEDLVGAWTLMRWEIHYQDRNRITYPFGEDAQGMLIYAGNGWMSATMSRRNRTPFNSVSSRQASTEGKAHAVDEYLSYCARWWINDGKIVHAVVLSLNPTLLHTNQMREPTLVGTQLELCARETDGSLQGKRIHSLLWQRAGLHL